MPLLQGLVQSPSPPALVRRTGDEDDDDDNDNDEKRDSSSMTRTTTTKICPVCGHLVLVVPMRN
jgi:hypothetical protein